MTRKNQKQIAVLVLSVLVLCLIGVAGQTMRRRNRAEAFLYDATALRLRVATLSQVQELAAQYGGHVEPSTCSPRGCGYFFSFDNGWLRRLRLAPRTWFSCTLGVADGVLDYRGVVLTSGNTSAVFGAFVDERLSSPKGVPEPFYIGRQWEGSGERWRIHIDMTADATPEQHRMAYSVNLRCLSKIGGCRDAQELLPSVGWDETTSNGASLHDPQ